MVQGSWKGTQGTQVLAGLCLELCSQPLEQHVPSLTSVPEEQLPCKTCFHTSPPLKILIPCRFISSSTTENIYMVHFQDKVLIEVLK